jgi:outer membrane protein assembly factor BamB
MRRSGMTKVELDDEGPPPADPTPSGGPPRRRWGLALVALVVVAVLGAVQWGIGARQRARDGRLDAVSGSVARVDPPLGVAWQPTTGEVQVLSSGVHVGGASVGVLVADDGSRVVAAIDDGTGRRLWSTPLDGPDRVRAGSSFDPLGRAGSCRALPANAAPADVTGLACLVTDGVQAWDVSDPPLTLRPATHARLLLLDARTGRLTAERSLPAPRTFAVVGDLLVTVVVDVGGGATLTAQDLHTGATRWTWTSRGPVGVATELGDALLAVFAIGDAVGFAGPDGTVTVLSHDGRLLHARAGGGTWSLDDSGTRLLLPGPGTSAGEARTIVVTPGHPDVAVQGVPADATVDDRSIGDVVLTTQPGLSAWDPATGRRLWRADVAAFPGVVVLRGRVYVRTSTGVVAVDGRTGAIAWKREGEPGLALDAPTSDARHLLVVETPYTGVPPVTLVAYDLSSGARAWTADLPTSVARAYPAGRVLLAYAPAGPEVLRTGG